MEQLLGSRRYARKISGEDLDAGRRRIAHVMVANVQAITPQLSLDAFLAEYVTFQIHGGGVKRGIEAMAYGIASRVYAATRMGKWSDNSPQVTCMAGLYFLGIAEEKHAALAAQQEGIKNEAIRFPSDELKEQATARDKEKIAFLEAFIADLNSSVTTYGQQRLRSAEKYLVVLKHILLPVKKDASEMRRKLVNLLNNGAIESAYALCI